jgi:hypothetical protein
MLLVSYAPSLVRLVQAVQAVRQVQVVKLAIDIKQYPPQRLH